MVNNGVSRAQAVPTAYGNGIGALAGRTHISN